MHQQRTAFENIIGKGEIALNEQFLLFPQCFLLNQIIVSPFVHILDTISLFAAELEKPKIWHIRKRVKYMFMGIKQSKIASIFESDHSGRLLIRSPGNILSED